MNHTCNPSYPGEGSYQDRISKNKQGVVAQACNLATKET
jgi:hypothetical protein